MNTLKFKAGDDVPEYIAKPAPDCAPLKPIKFSIDAEAFFYNGSWHLLPMEPLGNRAFFVIAAEQPNSFVSIEGGPTITYELPLNSACEFFPENWRDALDAMPENYGDRTADQYEISLPDNAVWYRGQQ